MTGSVHIPLKEIFRILSGSESESVAWQYIILKIRVPKALTALLAGAALAVSGLQMQTLFRNPLASPSELGITSGATLGIGALVLTGGLGAIGPDTFRQLGIGSSWLAIVMATLGSGLVFSLLLLIARKVTDNVILLIAGVMIGTLTLSLTSIWQYQSQPEQLQAFIIWTFGSLGGVTGPQLGIFTLVLVAGLLGAFALSKTLNTLLLGEHYARSMGLSIRRSRFLILLSTCLLTGTVTAFCGPIGFIGIAVPHLARSLMGTSNHLKLVPACALTGAILLLLCDILTQLPGSQSALPVNVVTALIGAPVVLWIIIKMNNLGSSFS